MFRRDEFEEVDVRCVNLELATKLDPAYVTRVVPLKAIKPSMSIKFGTEILYSTRTINERTGLEFGGAEICACFVVEVVCDRLHPRIISVAWIIHISSIHLNAISNGEEKITIYLYV